MMLPFHVCLPLFHVMTFHVLMVAGEASAEPRPHNNSISKSSQSYKCRTLEWGKVCNL